MRYFVSAGEPSGDLHGANLLTRIRQNDPAADFFGFGGRKMESAGCSLIHPLAENPIIGITKAVASVPAMLRHLATAKAAWRKDRPDAVVLIDYPGFHWHVAKAAKQIGVPVVYFIPPQIWGWASWRVARMRRLIDHVLCTLPFEEAWYKQRGVMQAEYIGHPFFDDLAERTLDDQFIADQRGIGRIVALLPGSRSWEVRANTLTLLRTASKIAAKHPGVRFMVPAFRPQHAEQIWRAAASFSLPLEIHVGRTPEVLAAATAAVSVSGSVSLELLYYGVPTAIIYQIPPLFQYVLRPLLIHTPYVTLVNLMAGRSLFPEFVGCTDRSTEIATVVDRWLAEESERSLLVKNLQRLKRLYAKPGATSAAARRIVEIAGGRTASRQAA